MGKSFYKIAWVQNDMVGMENAGKVVFRDPENRYVFLNALHPENSNLEFDALLIYNCTFFDFSLKIPKNTVIMAHNEPAYQHLGWNAFMYDEKATSQADVLFSAAPNQFNVPTYYPYALLNYDWMRVKSYPEHYFNRKSKLISCVASSKTISLRHAQRALYLQYLKKNFPKCDLYGRDVNEIPHLIYGLKDYKYSIAVENSTEPNFFTEKILYCFHSLTVPFYDGCSNIGDFFPKDALIPIDVNHPKESLEIIQDELNNGDNNYQNRLDSLKKAREIFYEKFELFGRIYQEVVKLYEREPQKKVELQKIYAPETIHTDHTKQVNEAYFYARYAYSYYVKGRRVPYRVKQKAKKMSEKCSGCISSIYVRK